MTLVRFVAQVFLEDHYCGNFDFYPAFAAWRPPGIKDAWSGSTATT
jgi:hypothetical protein